MNHNLQIALKWAAAGASVFPVEITVSETKIDKVPRVKWRALSTTNPETIKDWWKQWPDSAPGIDLAKVDVVVLDGDRHGGPDGVAGLNQFFKDHNLNASAIPIVITPQNGGRHAWFRQPAGEPLGNRDKAVKDSGINVRGAGGFVVAPGTLLPDGRRYQRCDGTPSTIGALINGTIPVLPPSIATLLRAKPNGHDKEAAQQTKVNGRNFHSVREEAYALATLDRLATGLAGMAPESGRNNALNNAAMRMGHMIASGWIERPTVERRLFEAAQACGLVDDTSFYGVKATLKSGLDAGEKEPEAPLQDREERRASSTNSKPNSSEKEEHEAKAETNAGANDRDASGGDDFVLVQAGTLHEIATKSEQALIAAGAPLYARGGEIVCPIIEEVAAFKGRKTKVTRLKPVTVDMLRDHLSQATRWRKYDGRAQKIVAADPPVDVAKIILARDGKWKFSKLTGIITTPTLRPDGSILSEPGYDPKTGLLLLAPPSMPPILQHPSREDALAALALLDELLAEFPFVSEVDRSVARSALMAPVARGAMQVVPMHACTAPEAGSGKSYLFDLASAIATGEIAPVIAAGRTEEETEKRLSAELMTAQPIVSIDNLNGELGGDFICQAIERPIIKPRVLGLSETRRIENTVTIFGNGNNFQLVGDMLRRVILCSLDANLERPELRQFCSDPVATVLADRGRYVAAVLTIIRAYLAAGCPDQCPSFASFSDWSRLIRSPLVWLGCPDPVATIETTRAGDPKRGQLGAVVAAWLSAIGADKPISTGDLVQTSFAGPDMALNKALIAVASFSGRSEIDARRLGVWLGRNRDRVVNNFKIRSQLDAHSKQQLWWLAAKETAR